MDRYSSQELIKGIRKRDNAVLSFIYQNYFQSVLHFVNNNSGTNEDAKDVFQEALIVVFKNIRADKNFQINSSLQTYIFSIARILWIKHLNSARLKMSGINESHEYLEFVEPEPFKEHDFEYALYQRVFLQLPKDCRKIINLNNKGATNKEIATKMGFKNEAYIARRKHFCKEYLIRLIKQDPDFESDKR